MSLPENPVLQLEPELPLDERAYQTEELIYDFRSTLEKVPEFQRAAAEKYLEHTPGPNWIQFRFGGSGFVVDYRVMKFPTTEMQLESRLESLVIRKYDNNFHEQREAIELEMSKRALDDSCTYAVSVYTNRIESETQSKQYKNTKEAFKKIREFLKVFIPQDTKSNSESSS